MKKRGYNISYTINHNLCLGCGICADSCKTNSISIKEINGEYRPYINNDICVNSKGCHKCSTVCPGLGVSIAEIGMAKYGCKEGAKYHRLIGFYQFSYSGYATDYDTRFHGASGGLLTAFVAFLLDKGYISAAVVANNDLSQPFLNRTVLVHNSDELYKARSSKYCPVKFDGIVEKVKKEVGSVVIIGLPCIIHGFRKYEKTDLKFREKIFGYFGLYCSCGRSFNLTEYVFNSRGIQKQNLIYFQYRDDGCLGYMIAKERMGRGEMCSSNVEGESFVKVTKTPFQCYYHPLRSFFIPHRCLLCIDHYAELADISFGDIHYGKYKEDKVGVNSVIIRNPQFDDLLKKAAEAGYIKIDNLTEEELLKCQASAPKKKERTGGILRLRKILGLKNPEYDVTLTKFVFLKSAAYYLFAQCQRYIGKRRRLWKIIKLMYRKQILD
jgi:coenzyme F420 hydrogenase subunit beta